MEIGRLGYFLQPIGSLASNYLATLVQFRTFQFVWCELDLAVGLVKI